MEHYYVISGNEYGADLNSKRNFLPEDFVEAMLHYNKVKADNYGCTFRHVLDDGSEVEVVSQINDENFEEQDEA